MKVAKRSRPMFWPIVGATALLGLFFFRGSIPALRRFFRIRRM